MGQLVYSPFGALNQLHRELTRVFDEEPASYESGSWVPQVDIKEAADSYRVVADIPGVAPNDVEITLDRNLLTIRGSRSTESETEEGGFKRRERTSGTFVRQFTLPQTVNDAGISAKANHGVLEITIPKGEGNKPRSIQVEV